MSKAAGVTDRSGTDELTVVNVVRFGLELAALVGFGCLGWSLTDAWPRWLLVVLLPVLAAAVWGRWMAPKSARQLRGAPRYAAEATFFAAAAVSFAVAGLPVVALVFAVVALVDTPLVHLREARARG